MSDVNIRCFVAMRIGNHETDNLFDNFIKPTVESVIGKGNCHRIDRVNSNNNIDAQIFTEINLADFIISDLTFTRPSVYFEAGYAEGKPVIYTAKTDHLNQANADDRRIHFDLLMRNIIDWPYVGSPEFANRLKDRIEVIAGPLLTKKRVSLH